MTTKSVKISVNLDGLRAELQRSLQGIIYLVASGLNTTDRVDLGNLSLPGKSIGMVLDNSLNWNTEQLQREFSTWLTSNGFRDSIEAVSSFLESAHKILTFWELTERQDRGEVLTGADWQNIVVRGGKKFNSLGFPDKIEHLKSEHNLALDSNLVEQVLSINVARNCLVHRNGIVTERDVNTEDKLEVKWSRMVVFIEGKEGEKEFIHGEPVMVHTGDRVGVQNREESELFALGQRVQFTPQEFADITWGLFLFGNSIVMKINEYGLVNGFIKTTKSA